MGSRTCGVLLSTERLAQHPDPSFPWLQSLGVRGGNFGESEDLYLEEVKEIRDNINVDQTRESN